LHILYRSSLLQMHMGGLGGGHYTAFALNAKNGKWYHFDDDRVAETSESKVLTSSAYMLFYKRRD
jgi:ubiquitin C-terminal hydrolase